ncbi:MAG: SpoIIE family protein phosphatase [Balneolaceae bacterium]
MSNGKIESGDNLCLEWCVARYPKGGEEISGDLFFIKNSGKKVLIAVMDGLGHGEQAYEASKQAVQSLNSFTNESLISLVKKCHEDLKSTRGVVMSLAVLDSEENTLTWLGVGNVEGILLRGKDNKFKKADTILSCRGILGYKLPLLKASMISITPGDMFFFSTDGVRFGYEEEVNLRWSPESIIKKIVNTYIDSSDDSLILAARYKNVNH